MCRSNRPSGRLRALSIELPSGGPGAAGGGGELAGEAARLQPSASQLQRSPIAQESSGRSSEHRTSSLLFDQHLPGLSHVMAAAEVLRS